MPEPRSLFHPPRRILVCGSRYYADAKHIRRVLAEYLPDDLETDEPTVMHGDCRGADKLAHDAAVDLGFWVEAHPANWKAHGKAAGPIRNRQMLDLRPELVIAFGNGVGTRHTIAEASTRGIPVRWED